MPFVISFCVGMCVMMLFAPKPRVVIKFPRPDTQEHVYKGEDGGCFRIKARKVSCSPKEGVNLQAQPIAS